MQSYAPAVEGIYLKEFIANSLKCSPNQMSFIMKPTSGSLLILNTIIQLVLQKVGCLLYQFNLKAFCSKHIDHLYHNSLLKSRDK